MKKLTTLVLATVALGVSASAATITVNCSPFPIQFAGGSGSGPISCPGFTGGGTLTGASLTLYADYTFGGPATDIQLTFSIGAPAGSLSPGEQRTRAVRATVGERTCRGDVDHRYSHLF